MVQSYTKEQAKADVKLLLKRLSQSIVGLDQEQAKVLKKISAIIDRIAGGLPV